RIILDRLCKALYRGVIILVLQRGLTLFQGFVIGPGRNRQQENHTRQINPEAPAHGFTPSAIRTIFRSGVLDVWVTFESFPKVTILIARKKRKRGDPLM